MIESVEIPAWELLYVYELMWNKFRSLNSERFPNTKKFPTKLAQVFGASKVKVDTSKPKLFETLTFWINEDEKVKEHLGGLSKKRTKDQEQPRTIPSGQMYKDILAAHKEKNETSLIGLKGKNAYVFFKFLGFEDIDDFRKKCFKDVRYRGFYYSHTKDKVRDFSFTLRIPNTEQKVIADNINGKTNVVYKATLRGFHNGSPNTELSGRLVPFQQCWVARLDSYDYFLDLAIHIGSEFERSVTILEQFNQLHCTISGTGSLNYLYCGECILVKEGVGENLELETKKYLNLRREKFVVNVQDMLAPERLALMINGHTLKAIKHLSDSTYRILTATPGGSVIQSKFVINEDYTSEITIPYVEKESPYKVGEKTMKCSLSFLNIMEDRLLIFAYKDQNILYSTTVIEIPQESKTSKDNSNMIEGAFCVTDHDNNLSPIGNVFVMAKDSLENCSPGIFGKKDIKNLQADPIAKILIDALSKNIKNWITGWSK